MPRPRWRLLVKLLKCSDVKLDMLWTKKCSITSGVLCSSVA